MICDHCKKRERAGGEEVCMRCMLLMSQNRVEEQLSVIEHQISMFDQDEARAELIRSGLAVGVEVEVRYRVARSPGYPNEYWRQATIVMIEGERICVAIWRTRELMQVALGVMSSDRDWRIVP